MIKKFKLSITWAILMMIACTAQMPLHEPSRFHIPYSDKIVHFGIFLILSFLISYELKNIKYQTALLCACYGILIEIIQIFLPWRSFEFADIIADTLGAVAGIFVAKYVLNYISNKKNKTI